jgi:hypothetical protein
VPPLHTHAFTRVITAHMPSNVSAVVRAVACLALAFLLFKSTVLNEHLQLTPVGVVMLLVFEGLVIASAVRIYLKDAQQPPASVLHFDTRQINIVQELVISGGAAMFGWFGLYILMGAGAHEVWAGHVELNRGPKPFEYVIGVFFLATAFFGFFWRPTFTLDRVKRTIQRFPFGRALPLRKGPERPAEDVDVVSQPHFRPNTGIQVGDMIRGTLGKNTFELELLRGQNTPQHLAARVAHWKGALLGQS